MNKKMVSICGALALLALASPVAAQDANKLVWGGGDPATSAYSGVYVPRVIEVLGSNALNGYTWGGPTQGTVDNAGRVLASPTNLAVGQWDILSTLQGTPGPDGRPYAFTVIAQDIGPECLYMITKEPGYKTFGDVIGNAWQIDLATGGELSGSYGTWKVLAGIYPDLADGMLNSPIEKLDGASAIVKAVVDGTVTHGFFVQRPDPNSEVFATIEKAGLSYVPIVDFQLESKYTFQSLKVTNGGIFGGAKTVDTACTSVALITGDPISLPADAGSLTKRLKATIDRLKTVPAENLRPNLATWRDMWDNFTTIAADNAKALMEASRKALEDIAKENAKG